ncbi:MAG: hypothetical protein P1U32_02300 [Legionellaceae bacterium]|nr:hypothetical protein [Legionellaceae bacterium]
MKEFDDKLAKCLEKIRTKENLENRDEIAAMYQKSAVNFRELIKKNNDDFLLGLANQTFDNLLNEKSNDAVNEKFLKRVDYYRNDAKQERMGSILCSFIGVAAGIAALVFAIPTQGISLLFLLNVIHGGASGYTLAQDAANTSKEAEVYESFAKSNRGLFSSDYLTDKQPQDKVVQNPMQQGHEEGEADDIGNAKKMD